MFIRYALIVAALFAISLGEALACSCASRGHFVDYAKASDGVVHVTVVGYGDRLSHGDTLYESMTVEIVSVLKGNIQFDSIVLLGDPGFLCREYVDSTNLVIGNEYIIALHGDEATQSFGGCGESWLAVQGDVASGVKWTSEGAERYTIELDELLETLDSK